MEKIATIHPTSDSQSPVTSDHNTHDHATPLLNSIEYPAAARFRRPEIPTYSLIGSIGSVASLLFMSTLATLMFLQLYTPNAFSIDGTWAHFLAMLQITPNTVALPAWVWLPFAFTIFGATLGALFELGLIVTGHPFQQQRSSFSRFIAQVRFLNLAPVATTIFFFTCAIMIQDSALLTATLLLAVGATATLGFALFFGTQSPLLPISLLGIQLIQIGIVLISPHELVGSTVALLLVGQAILQFTSLTVGTATPWKSTFFHLCSTIAGLLLFAAIMQVNAIDPSFANQVAPTLSPSTLLFWAAIAMALGGVMIVTKLLPDSYNNFRAMLSNSIWTPLYFKLISADRFPDPINLSKVYDSNPPKKSYLKPYYLAHPQHLMKNLSIPAIPPGGFERNVTAFKTLLDQAKSAFKLISWLDHNIPQANLKTPIEEKPRLTIWSDGSDYWPALFKKTLFGLKMPNNGDIMKTPELAITRYQEGQLLAYLAESGVANPFLKPAEEQSEGELAIDFRYLEKYQTKSDYESYGGIAYFTLDSESQALRLTAIQGPHMQQVIKANPHDPQFRRAESMLLASMYYEVISGKHLAEIHMTYNLVEVSMHNAFDAQGQWRHPLRTALYIHFFSHELAEEITTEHLVQEGAVFSQIFATTHDAMINHLNDTYANFHYGADEDFEQRAQLMTLPNGDLAPNACIKWELEYVDIWQRYASDLIDVIYKDDSEVEKDIFLQDFHQGLNEVLLQGLPERYDQFQTKKGVARFVVDTIHHTVIRHQVYGTTGIRAALDPRISSTQIPRDSGTPALDEWRSLAYVAQATGEARFTLLTGPNGKDFTYLLEGVSDQYSEGMKTIFNRLQSDLQALEQKWTQSDEEKAFNYTYFRATPSVLHTGPGY